jgi:hypothetical protein
MPFMRRHCRGIQQSCWEFSLQPRYVSFWHKADMVITLIDVRFQG